MQDNFQREINYLRVSVTDRCNLRCLYCMPPEGVKNIPHQEILRFEEIVRLIQAAVFVGIRKVRLTGGEPLVRRNLPDLIQALNSFPEINDLSLTTNGTLFADQARELKEAGLKRVNISLDTLKPERYRYITRGGKLNDVFEGIKIALALDLKPVKINTVVIKGFNEDEICDLARVTLQDPLHLRFIELMPVGLSNHWAPQSYLSAEKIKMEIEARFGPLRREDGLSDIPGLFGGGPAKYYRLAGAKGTIGFIAAQSSHFCASCNRLRLSATGALRPCLYNKTEVDLKEPLRKGATLEELTKLFIHAIQHKPKGYSLTKGWLDKKRVMSQIGG